MGRKKKERVDVTEITYSPQTLTKLNDAVKECLGAIAQEQSSAEFRDSVAERIKEEVGMEIADFRALVAEAAKQKSTKAVEKHTFIAELCESMQTARAAAHGRGGITNQPEPADSVDED